MPIIATRNGKLDNFIFVAQIRQTQQNEPVIPLSHFTAPPNSQTPTTKPPPASRTHVESERLEVIELNPKIKNDGQSGHLSPLQHY